MSIKYKIWSHQLYMRIWLILIIYVILSSICICSSSVSNPPPEGRRLLEEINDDVIGGEEKSIGTSKEEDLEVTCRKLLAGQYLCPQLSIDPETQQPYGCQPDGRAPISCYSIPGLICKETGNRTFIKDTPCKWTNGYHFDTALLLSIFLGPFGIDRFYLGYPAIGLFKFSTLGFFFLGHILDILLIASQTVGPADGSHYIISYFGAGINIISTNEDTARRPQPDWY